MVEYNLNAFRPIVIRKALGKKDTSSSAGYDNIIYEYLFNMLFIHKVLATTFTMIRDTGKVKISRNAAKSSLSQKMAILMTQDTLK